MGIPTVYLRSSSMNTWNSYCEMQYYFIYGLGFVDKVNVKAEMGTVFHKVLEGLALIKLAIQEGKNYIDDDVFGHYTFNEKDLYKESFITQKQQDGMNKHRSFKQMYKWACQSTTLRREGEELIKDLLNKSFDYYKSRSENEWDTFAKYTIENWIWILLEYNNGEYDVRYREIYMPEQSFNITIPHDWAKYEYDLNGKKIEGNLSIKGTIDLVTVRDDFLEIVDYKGLPLDTPIPTIDGWSTMGEIQVGDDIFDKDGNITKVTAKSQIKNKECYKILFDDGTSVICDDEHLWLLNNDKVVPVTDLKQKDQISCSKSLNTQHKKLNIDPYLLGVWIGYEPSKQKHVFNLNKDIIKEIASRGYTIYPQIKYNNDLTARVGGLATELMLDKLDHKFIPAQYLRGSHTQRLNLLQGFLDVKGIISSNHEIRVSFSSSEERDQYLELLYSLGQKPYLSKTYNETFQCYRYVAKFKPVNIIPFTIPAKIAQVSKIYNNHYAVKRITSITKLENTQQTQCISVDSQSSTYLCTKFLIPTHNTGQRKDWSTGKEKTYDKLMNDLQLQLYYWAAFTLIQKHALLTIFFVRDGGPTSLNFDEYALENVEKNIKRIFEELTNCKSPKPRSAERKDIQCTWCGFYKNKFPNDTMNMCSRIEKDIELYDIETVTKQRISKDHKFEYQNPGE